MKNKILEHLNNPPELEKLYRQHKSEFEKTFVEIYPEIKESAIAQVWNERLSYSSELIQWGSKKDWFTVLSFAFFAGLVAKFPDWVGIDYDYYMPRNIGFILFPSLITFFIWKNKLPLKQSITLGFLTITAAIYINLLPDNPQSHTLILAAIHLPLFLWTLWGFSFISGKSEFAGSRIHFLRFNGDFIVMAAVMQLSGMILTGITIGLFNLIGFNIAEFYMKNIGVWGFASIPVLSAFIVTTNPQLVNKVSPVIAKIFTPLVLVMLIIYLIAVFNSGKDPYNDREFLLVFNALLIGVMALILFSIAETTKKEGTPFGIIVLFLLSFVTILVNGVALSAILFRISEWGFTPNRTAVLGSNVLILINLLQVSYRLFLSIKDQSKLNLVAESIGTFLPIYSGWTFFVAFFFPLLFGFK